MSAAPTRLATADQGPARPVPVTSWEPIPLEPIVSGIMAGEIVGPVPSLMQRDDGVALLYRGELHSIAAEPECGKSFVIQGETARLVSEGEDVVYLDFEDTPPSIVARLLALGAPAEALLSHLTLVHPEQALHPDALDALLAGRTPALAVIDGVTEAMGLLGLEIASNDDIGKFRARLARPLAATGAAVVEIDHVVKDRESRGRYAIGGQHKLAGVAVAYSITPIQRPSRTRPGVLKLVVEKDRHGHVRAHEDSSRVVALARITPAEDGARVTVTLTPPDSVSDEGTFRPTVLMERVSRAIEAHPGLSKRGIREGVKGKASAVDLALELLVTDGHVRPDQDGQAIRHHVVTPFREADDTHRVPVSSPCPDRVPDTGVHDRVPVSPPPRGDTDTGHAATSLTAASAFESWTDDELQAVADAQREAA